MKNAIQAIRGMNDVLPGETAYWQKLEQDIAEVLRAYSYLQIRVPIVEKTELFARSIGEVTDIVEKEMYSFEDRNGDNLSLRPEGTASVVRAALQHGLLHNQVQRLWYIGPMFRHERPQKGRYRQFHQVGVETFGLPGPEVEAEQIMLTVRLWRRLGLDGLRLEINSLGSPECRAEYRALLVEYFSAHIEALDEDSRRRLDGNPLRILDSKNPAMKSVLENAPDLHAHLDAESAEHFARLRGYLDAAGVEYTVNPRLVRGLDYYNRTVFEWMTDELGAQGTVCAGGRYDGLVSQLGGNPVPACGFGIGLERLSLLLQQRGSAPLDVVPDVYVIWNGDATVSGAALRLAETVRDGGLRVLFDAGGGSFKSQFRRADKSGARHALVLGEQEVTSGEAVIKDLRRGEQVNVAFDDVTKELLKR